MEPSLPIAIVLSETEWDSGSKLWDFMDFSGLDQKV